MLPRLTEMQAKYPVIGDVRGRGAMLAVELVQARHDHEPNTEEIAAVSSTATPRACWC